MPWPGHIARRSSGAGRGARTAVSRQHVFCGYCTTFGALSECGVCNLTSPEPRPPSLASYGCRVPCDV
eukprot:6658100-Prymnesium_polylepis.1